MESFVQDLRYALRSQLRRPAFTAAVVLSLGLGIGAATTIFILVNATLLHPLPGEDPERIVTLYGTKEGTPGFLPISFLNYEDLRDQSRTLDGLAAFQWLRPSLLAGGEAERISCQIATENYFEIFGVQPAHGRLFTSQDPKAPGSNPVLVLSYRFWRLRFGGDPAIVGRTILLNGQQVTVAGVASEGFKGANTFFFNGPDLWIPMSMYEQMSPFRALLRDRSWGLFELVGRRTPGATHAEAVAELAVLTDRLEREHPDVNQGQGVQLLPLSEALVHPQQRTGYVNGSGILTATLGLLLLMTGANVASLMLARGVERRREVSLRLALGAGRLRLVRQLVTEGIVLALMGGCVGLLVGLWGPRFLWRFRPPFFLEGALDLGLSARVLLFTLAAALAMGILFGLAPALQALRDDLVRVLKEQAAAAGRMRFRVSFLQLLVIGQVALSLLALVGAGLFLRSVRHALSIDPGFRTGDILNVSFDAGAQGYDETRGRHFYRQVLDRVESLPGVVSATFSNSRPLNRGALYRLVEVEGDASPDADRRPPIRSHMVGPRYFETLGIPIRQGRAFTPQDRADAPLVAVVNETMARALWPGRDPVGQRFRDPDEDLLIQVVGVAADARYTSLGEPPTPLFYLPLEQIHAPEVTLQVRTREEPRSVLKPVLAEIRRLEAAMPFSNIETMEEALLLSLWAPRLGAALLSIFGLLALALATTGIYGVMAYSIGQRRHEIGIRTALGARRGEILGLILRQAAVIVGIGLALGLAGAMAGARLIGGLLYGTAPTDIVTYVATALLLAIVALSASFLAARRSVAADPARVLRSS